MSSDVLLIPRVILEESDRVPFCFKVSMALHVPQTKNSCGAYRPRPDLPPPPTHSSIPGVSQRCAHASTPGPLYFLPLLSGTTFPQVPLRLAPCLSLGLTSDVSVPKQSCVI